MQMPGRTTLRTRLTLWYVAVLALLLVVYATVLFAFQYALLTRQLYHDEVQDVVTAEGLLYFDSAGKLQFSQNYFSRPQSHLLVDRLMEVRGLNSSVLYRSATLNGMALGGPLKSGEGDTGFNERIVRLDDGSHVFVVSHIHSMQGRTVVIRVGYSLVPLRTRMLQFLLILVVAIPAALLLAGIAGQYIAKRALRPLEQMAAHAELITVSNLSDRLNVGNGHDELGQMARVFNHLLQRLEGAFSQLQRFTSDAAHELRTPLAAIRTIGEVALEQQCSPQAHREALESVLEEANRLDQTVASLLLLAKAESSARSGAEFSFIFTDLLREVTSLLKVLGEERGIRILQDRTELGRVSITADRNLMRIALINVLHNALKFSPDHGVIRISFEQFNEPARLKIAIRDEGAGIGPGEYQRIFERFYTSPSAKFTSQNGTGLGLATAKLIIERSGGQIYFDEASEAGAVCMITLPGFEPAAPLA